MAVSTTWCSFLGRVSQTVLGSVYRECRTSFNKGLMLHHSRGLLLRMSRWILFSKFCSAAVL
jgi:hypothetical protein